MKRTIREEMGQPHPKAPRSFQHAREQLGGAGLGTSKG